MATITRTQEMFQIAADVEPRQRTGWKTLASFVSWLLTPVWATDAAEQLSLKCDWPTEMHHPNTWA